MLGQGFPPAGPSLLVPQPLIRGPRKRPGVSGMAAKPIGPASIWCVLGVWIHASARMNTFIGGVESLWEFACVEQCSLSFSFDEISNYPVRDLGQLRGLVLDCSLWEIKKAHLQQVSFGSKNPTRVLFPTVLHSLVEFCLRSHFVNFCKYQNFKLEAVRFHCKMSIQRNLSCLLAWWFKNGKI